MEFNERNERNELGEAYEQRNAFGRYEEYVDEEASPEEKKRIRVPALALISSFLIVALMIAGIVSSIKYLKNNASLRSANAEKKTETVASSSGIPEASLRSGSHPSDELHYASTSYTTDEYSHIESAMSAVVSIDVVVQQGYTNLAGSGSGVIVSPDGYIVTCNHVVEGADKIYVYLQDDTSSEAELIGTDVINDLAVLKIDGTDLPYAVFGDSSTLSVGEEVFAVGNALGQLSNTYTRGVVSGLDRKIKVEGQEMTLLQTDAAINHGNSGGGLFRSSDGTLIGIVNAKSAGEDIEGLGFAIPSAVVGDIIGDIMDYGFVTGRPYLGVSTESVALSGYGFFTSYHTYPRVVEVDENSAAKQAGLAVGDVILSVGSTTVSSPDELLSAIASHSIGDEVEITVLRGKQNLTLTATLGERALPEE